MPCRWATTARLIFWMETAGLMDTLLPTAPVTRLTATAPFAGDGIFRMSVGLEDPEDIIADLSQVL